MLGGDPITKSDSKSDKVEDAAGLVQFMEDMPYIITVTDSDLTQGHGTGGISAVHAGIVPTEKSKLEVGDVKLGY